MDNVKKRVITTGGLAICTMAGQQLQLPGFACQYFISVDISPQPAGVLALLEKTNPKSGKLKVKLEALPLRGTRSEMQWYR